MSKAAARDWIEMRPEGLAFIDDAPLRVEIVVETSLARAQVWAAFVDATSWREWFPGVRTSAYPDQRPPYGVGTIRTADVEGQLFEETILAWDEPTQWTYRIDRCTAALAHAQVESTELAERADGGTRVSWILASDPLPELAAVRDVLPGILEKRLGEALRNLEARLGQS